MYNPLSAGRRHARRAAVIGLVATVLTALALFAAQSSLPAAYAALAGGLGVVAGSALGSWISLGGTQAQGAGPAFVRLILGLGVKWVVVLAALLFSVVQGWPALPLLIAVIVAVLVPLVAELFQFRTSR